MDCFSPLAAAMSTANSDLRELNCPGPGEGALAVYSEETSAGPPFAGKDM